MPNEAIGNIAIGSVLLHAGTRLPTPLAFERKPMLNGWVSDPKWQFVEFQRAVEQAGWHCFFVPPEIKAGALARNENHAVMRALRKLAGRAQKDKFNTLQITALQKGKVLGLNYARITANLRHLQDKLILAPASERLLQESAEQVTRSFQSHSFSSERFPKRPEQNVRVSLSNSDTRRYMEGGSYGDETDESGHRRASYVRGGQNQMDSR